jgi:arsenite-transporting ATPase
MKQGHAERAPSGAVVPRFLRDRHLRLILFGGKGGAGKTTCAAATAIRLAESEPARRLTLVSTDPAHSLKDSLAGWRPPANLEVVEFEAGEYLEAFRRKHSPQLRELAARGTFLDDEDINRFLDLSLPGMDELFAFLEISRWVGTRPEEDRIVVDTAPTGHTLRLLAMPELLRRWVDALDALLAKHRYMMRVFRGRYQADELDDFLDDLGQSVDRMQALLQDAARCQFVPAMVAEALSVHETERLLDELDRLGINASEVVVNRLTEPLDCPVCANLHAQQMRELARLPVRVANRTCWGVPWVPVEARSAAGLETFWDRTWKLDPRESPRTLSPRWPLPTHVENPAPLPAALRLLIFAGKGGVGKTTLACATAVRLARERKKVLLFSTDPAHSLSDCLDVPLGAEPKAVMEGLTAFEIDATAEFSALQAQYRKELDGFLSTVLHNLDITFDREVMERMLDLAPPGLDEIMALSRATEFLPQREHDVLILDAAPTGHLIRLLELPQIIDQWIKAFFELFLKYRRVFRVPRIADRLVQLSKDLRVFRKVLRDPQSAALHAVSILTRMAFEETIDLEAACRRMQVNAPVIFLNLVTPRNTCDACHERAREEQVIAAEFQEALSDSIQVRVFRQTEPRGLEPLRALGDALYRRAE